MHGLLLLLFYAPKSDTKGRSGCGVYRVKKAGVYLPFIKRYIEIETRGRSASCAARPEGAGEGSRPQGASMRSQRLAGILDRRAAWIYSPARASPRKRIDHDCALGSRHLSCNLRPLRMGDPEEGKRRPSNVFPFLGAGWGQLAKNPAKLKKNGQKNKFFARFFGDLAGNRTRDCAVRGRRLNRLTTRPYRLHKAHALNAL